MNRRFLLIIISLLAASGISAGLAFAWHVAMPLDLETRAPASSIRIAAAQPNSQPGISAALALTPTTTTAATATPTTVSVLALTATATSSPTATTVASASPGATGTPTVMPTSTQPATATPSATATATLASTATPTVTPTLAPRLAITTTGSFRFKGTLETRRNGVLQATETFSGEKAGEDYRVSATYKDAEGTVNENEYVLVGAKLYARSASKVAGEVVGSPLAGASWAEVDPGQHSVIPRDLLDAFVKRSQQTAISSQPSGDGKTGRSSDGAQGEVDAVAFRSTSRFASGTAYAERRTGRLAMLEARQEIAVSPAISVVVSATMAMSDFDAPLSIAPSALDRP